MKRFLFVMVAFLLVASVVYAQQPTSAQIRQSAEQLLSQSQSNSNEFEEVLAGLRASNTSNNDAAIFNQLRSDIQRLENSINSEESLIKDSLDRGFRVNPEAVNRIERLIHQHRTKVGELESFVARTGR